MSSKYLGQPFDIHGGGADLIFPHHENEIAQSEGAKGCALARYWLHNGMVTVEQEKMSKSLGNFLTIEAALSQVSTPEVLRQVLLSSHYRMALDFSTQKLTEAEKGLTRIYETLARADEAIGDGTMSVPDDSFFIKIFREAMDDDCNTPRALGVIFDVVREINRSLDAGQITEAAIFRSEIARIGRGPRLVSRTSCPILGASKADQPGRSQPHARGHRGPDNRAGRSAKREKFSARGRNSRPACRARHRAQGQPDGDDVDGEIAVSETR